MDPHEVVDEMKELGASEDAIKARLESLGVASSKRKELHQDYDTTSHSESDTPYSFLLDYLPYWITGVFLVSAIILYFVNFSLLVYALVYGTMGAVIIFPVTWVLRTMTNAYSKGYNRTYSGVKDYILAILIAIFVGAQGFVTILLAPLFAGIPILIALMVFYDLTAKEAFMTTVFMIVTLLVIVFALSYTGPLLIGLIPA